jgi:lipopolysaccharide transport system permease protein
VAAVILAGLMAWYQVWPTWRLLALPALVLLAMATALGPGLIMTALTVRYRDVRFVIPFVVQVGLYASPIAYSSAIVRERLGDAGFLAYSLNPMVGVVDGFRWAILGGPSNIFWPGLLLSVALAVGLCFGGLRYFRRTERVFADII